jgi:hypothetical protein
MATAEATRTFFEIVNPSDAYSIDGTDKAAACAATLFLGEGFYGLNGPDGSVMGPFIFGGAVEWFAETFGRSLDDYLSENKAAVAAALDTVMIGDASHRRVVEAAMARLPESERAAFWADAHDEKRSSLNDIGRRAKSLADALRS